jgi:hypothetical protein
VGDILLLVALVVVFSFTACSDPGIIPKQNDEELALQQENNAVKGSICGEESDRICGDLIRFL